MNQNGAGAKRPPHFGAAEGRLIFYISLIETLVLSSHWFRVVAYGVRRNLGAALYTTFCMSCCMILNMILILTFCNDVYHAFYDISRCFFMVLISSYKIYIVVLKASVKL